MLYFCLGYIVGMSAATIIFFIGGNGKNDGI